MIAYKGFNKNLECTQGKGTFRYEIGKTYRENRAQCASAGFHCVEEPVETLKWYADESSRYCIVEAGGDINEDGDNKISCTEITVLKEITLQQLGALECKWMQDHPEREYSRQVKEDSARARGMGIVIVRGKNPKAAGDKGSTIYLLREGKGTKEIEEVGIYQIDGVEYLPDTYYRVDGRNADA